MVQIKPTLAESLKKYFSNTLWTLDFSETTFIKRFLGRTVKVTILSFRRFFDDRIVSRASELTYSTLFAIVPIMALIFAIAKGFGFENIMTNLLNRGYIGQSETIQYLTGFIDSYLEFAKSGAFIGIGLLFLFFSVFLLADGIETNMNMIWQIKRSRNLVRKITDYFSLILLLPVAIICLSGLSIFASSIMTRMDSFRLLGSFMQFLIKAMPYLLTGLVLTGFYMFMPNTRVKFKYAIIPGYISGFVFQALQYTYFSGQLSLSSYNAIYGSFAAIPLFLLWANTSWAIVLFGGELSYVSQNIDHFNYYKEPAHLSRRHKDYYRIMILSHICKRFVVGEKPYSALELSKSKRIPIRLVNKSLFDLIEAGLVEMVKKAEDEIIYYSPAIDISNITIGTVINKLYTAGYDNLEQVSDDSIMQTLKAIDEFRIERTNSIANKRLIDL